MCKRKKEDTTDSGTLDPLYAVHMARQAINLSITICIGKDGISRLEQLLYVLEERAAKVRAVIEKRKKFSPNKNHNIIS